MIKKKSNFKKIALIVLLIIIVWVDIGAIISPMLDKTNSVLIKGRFSNVKKGVGSGRNSGCIWYDLYIQESHDYYRISADNSDCFQYDSLLSQVGKGDTIDIYINKPVPFFSIAKPMVVSVEVNNYEYLSFDCVNSKTDEERVEIPLYSLGVGILLAFVIHKKEIGIWLKNR